MNVALDAFMRPYVGKQAILDSNLLLHLVAAFSPALVFEWKRLNAYRPQDLILLEWLLRQFSVLATTPHILTEVSNLSNTLPSWIKAPWFLWLGKQIDIYPERFSEARKIGLLDAFRFGLTDAALFALANEYVIVTIDWPLTNYLEFHRLPVINFNHLRSF